ncbi:hypothetical protein QVD17_14506 [Tagetes erecta]|uniref:K Homology domain-containing protein n=1 Tax=Tagetes erecta TaxID=13708 RepID=A0AAD8P2P3_TARER|nr:hypothetical protein QVD17_14506 [Tagetes erecta]
MEQVVERDKRKGKAKVGEADDELLLPKTMSNIDDRCIVLKLEGFDSDDFVDNSSISDLRFEDVVGPKSLDNVTRMQFLVRYKDIPNFLGEEDETLKRIQMVSGATIGIVSNAEVRVHHQAHLELWGTVDHVKIAELLIVDAITEMYGKSFVPTALMPPTICRNEVYIPLLQVASHLLGMSDENIVKIEARSGAWVQADPVELPPSGKPWMRRIHVYGSDQQITKVMIMINKVVSVEPYISEEPESSKLEDENKQHHDSERSKEAKSEK